jgi:xanthine dehydrogenase molybdopterin-binding subunit B
VKPAPFTYHRPATIEDAVRLLAELAPHDGRVLAGGQSLVPMMAFRLARPTHLIDINVVPGLNPMLVEGQLVGGVVQGLGGALYEEFRYDDRGEPLSVTFADYLMPTVREVPPIEVLLTEDSPSPLNPLGIKSAGEGGITPVGAVIAAAIDEAIGLPGGVTHLPATPQRIKAVLRAAPTTAAPLSPRDKGGGNVMDSISV